MENDLKGICKNCGEEMISIKGKKRKKFCCDNCRYQWWNNQKKLKTLKRRKNPRFKVYDNEGILLKDNATIEDIEEMLMIFGRIRYEII